MVDSIATRPLPVSFASRTDAIAQPLSNSQVGTAYSDIVLRQIEGLVHCLFIWRSSTSGRLSLSGLSRWGFAVVLLSRGPSINPGLKEELLAELIQFHLVLSHSDFKPFNLVAIIAECISITVR